MSKHKFDCGLFIGRFQPFHKGHFHVIKHALKQCDKLVIGIGSDNIIDNKNPIDAKTRELIIRKSIIEWGVEDKRITIVHISDYPDNDNLWFENLCKISPKFDVLFSGNEHVIKILTSHGIKAIKPKQLFRSSLSGTIIRERIRKGDKLSGEIAQSVEELIYSKINMTTNDIK